MPELEEVQEDETSEESALSTEEYNKLVSDNDKIIQTLEELLNFFEHQEQLQEENHSQQIELHNQSLEHQELTNDLLQQYLEFQASQYEQQQQEQEESANMLELLEEQTEKYENQVLGHLEVLSEHSSDQVLKVSEGIEIDYFLGGAVIGFAVLIAFVKGMDH